MSERPISLGAAAGERAPGGEQEPSAGLATCGELDANMTVTKLRRGVMDEIE